MVSLSGSLTVPEQDTKSPSRTVKPGDTMTEIWCPVDHLNHGCGAAGVAIGIGGTDFTAQIVVGRRCAGAQPALAPCPRL